MITYVFDIESDGLLNDITKIHCLSYCEVCTGHITSVTNCEDIVSFFSDPTSTLIGHNIYLYDIPAIEKVLGIKVQYKNIVDTLSISHYLNSSKPSSYKNGLEAYGVRFGVPKVKISEEQWSGVGMDVKEHQDLMISRCTEDVKINTKLWQQQEQELFELYDGDAVEIKRLINYLNSKLDVLLEQQNNPIPLDINLIALEIVRLEALVEEKKEPLRLAMPKLPVKFKVKKPKVITKADGSLSVAGERWFKLLEDNEYPKDYEDDLEYIKSYEEPNPDSTQQVKNWLLDLGWIPTHFKFTRNKETNEFKQVPQIKSEYDDADICDSVKELLEQEPAIEHLASYSTIKHRLTIFKGFLRDMNDDLTITASSLGITNTFRCKHRGLVNLPKPSAPYAEHIRECLISGSGRYMVGTDLKAIEDSTKMNYIFPFDPEYVKSMQSKDFDGHTEVAVKAGLMTRDEQSFFSKVDKTEDKGCFTSEELGEFKRLKMVRANGKTTNFAAVYGCKQKTLARNLKSTEQFAKKVLDAYWELNKSVNEFASTCITKEVGGQMWVQQPISRFWYTLRSAKDIFSSVNQGSAVYVFDIWVAYMRRLGLKISGQWHDEALIILDNNQLQEDVRVKIKEAMRLTNKKLQLNVVLDCSIDFGNSYLEVH